MPTAGRATLTQFLIEERRRAPGATGDLNALLTDVSLACKAISRNVAHGALTSVVQDSVDIASPLRACADARSHAIFVRANEWGGHLAGMVSRASGDVCVPPPQYPRGKYLLLFDPLNGAADVDVNVTVGSIFSVLRAATPHVDAGPADFLQCGTRQVCAGYAIYGPSTMLVLTLGNGTHAFTLEPLLGEWVLSHPFMRVPEMASEFAIDASNRRFWEPAITQYVDDCLAGRAGPRGNDFSMRWIASLVAEVHRILMRGGVFLSPRLDGADAPDGAVRHLCQANPLAMLIEQAHGRASDGRRRLMEIEPDSLDRCTGLVIGSATEVAEIERYHAEVCDDTYQSPLFARRGLFANG